MNHYRRAVLLSEDDCRESEFESDESNDGGKGFGEKMKIQRYLKVLDGFSSHQ